jgi:hypothetical protein
MFSRKEGNNENLYHYPRLQQNTLSGYDSAAGKGAEFYGL